MLREQMWGGDKPGATIKVNRSATSATYVGGGVKPGATSLGEQQKNSNSGAISGRK